MRTLIRPLTGVSPSPSSSSRLEAAGAPSSSCAVLLLLLGGGLAGDCCAWDPLLPLSSSSLAADCLWRSSCCFLWCAACSKARQQEYMGTY